MRPQVGDQVILKSGITGTYVGVDEESDNWPLLEIPGIGIEAIHPSELEEWWDG